MGSCGAYVVQPHRHELVAQPLFSLQVILAFVRSTTTSSGLVVEARLDQEIYRKGRKATERQLRELALRPTTSFPGGTTPLPRDSLAGFLNSCAHMMQVEL